MICSPLAQRRRPIILPLLACTLTLGALTCGGEESLALLDDAPANFAADGMTVVTFTAEVVFRGAPVADGKTVLFQASSATMFDELEKVAPGLGQSELRVRTVGGRARVFVLAPTKQHDITVEAAFTTVNKDVLAATRVLQPAPPPLVSADHFTFSCGPAQGANVGAFFQNRPMIRLPCSFSFKDAQGNDLPHTPIRVLAEAGEIEDIAAHGSEPRKITYVIAANPAVGPKDVEPNDAELAKGWVHTDGAGTHNPRDGLATVLVAVRGMEGFDDLNGNQVYDVGEPFRDLPEPFLDVDDDGMYDPFVDPIPCCDNNGNGLLDGPNGVWDDNVWIGRSFRVLWTGPLDLARSGFDPGSAITVAAGEAVAGLRLRLLDSNFNPLAAHGSTDRVDFTISPATRLSFMSPTGSGTQVPLQPATGIIFAQFSPWNLVQITESNELFRDFVYTVGDKRDAGSSAACNEYPFTLTAAVRYTPAPSYSGGSFSTQQVSMQASGTLLPSIDCPP